mgnify:FL=1
MAKICNKCGAINSDNAVVCNRCGKKLTISIEPSDSKVKFKDKNNAIKVGRKWNTKGIIITVGALVIIAGIWTVIKNSKPSKEWLKSNLPDKVIKYEINDEIITSSIREFEIEKRNTKNGIDDAFCKVILSDEYAQRTMYLEITSKKYDKGGWTIQTCSEYKDLKYKVEEKSGEENAEKYISENQLNFSNPQYTFENENSVMNVAYDASSEYEYLSISGNTYYTFELNKDKDKDEGYYKFDWRLETIDISEVEFNWNIEGDWKGRFGDDEYSEGYDLELTINDEEDGNFAWNGKAIYDACYPGSSEKTGEKSYYSGEGQFTSDKCMKYETYEDEIFKPENLKLNVYITVGYPQCVLIFEPDSAKVVKTGLFWSYNEDNANVLEKQL